MTIDQLRRFLDSVTQQRCGEAEVVVWCYRKQMYVPIAQVTFGASGIVYVQPDS